MENQLPMNAQTSIGCIPLSDRIYVKEEEAEKISKGGIIIPDTAEKEPKCTGTVVAMGAGFKGEPMTVQVGDRIRYSKFAGSEDTIDGVTYKTMREADVFCILVPIPARAQEEAVVVQKVLTDFREPITSQERVAHASEEAESPEAFQERMKKRNPKKNA